MLGMTRTALYGQSSEERAKKAPAKTKVLSTTQSGIPIVWRDPGTVETLDFVGGPGGREQAPKPPFTFIQEDTHRFQSEDQGDGCLNWCQVVGQMGSEVNAEFRLADSLGRRLLR